MFHKPKKFKHIPLQFDEIETVQKDGKRYYQTPVGDFISATSVLKVLDDGGIEKWVKRVGKKNAEFRSADAADRGEKLHLACEHYINNELDQRALDSRTRGLFRGIRPYLERWDNIRAQEIPLYSKTLKLAGRVDLVGEYQGQLAVGDFKTSNGLIDLKKDWCRRKLFKYFVQCAIYAVCLEEMYGMVAEKLVVIPAVSGAGKAQIFVDNPQRYIKELYSIKAMYEGDKNARSQFYYL